MIKERVKLLVVVVAIVLVGMGGCKKCYECSAVWSHFYCYNSTDTIGFQTVTGKKTNDTISYYRSIGYTCDTVDFYYRLDGVYSNPVCGKEGYDIAMYNQDKCEATK